MHKSTVVFSVLTCICLFSVFLFRESFRGYFFQDDWFSLTISRANSIDDIYSFFLPRKDVVYYRPVGMQLYFFILSNLFALNALPFHISAFFVHIVNIFLVWNLIKMITKSDGIPLVAAFFYGLGGMHFILFYWPSTFSFILGPFFYFLAIITYIKNRQSGQYKKPLTSLILYAMGLFSNEIMVTLPIIIFLYEAIFFVNLRHLKNIIGYFILLLPYGYLRLQIGQVPLSETYVPGTLGFFSTFRSYIFWVFNWPEEIRNQFIGPLTINPDFIKDFRQVWLVLILSSGFMLLILLLAIVTSLYSLLKKSSKKTKFEARLIVFGLLWFSSALCPLLFFPYHTFPYYLVVPSAGLFLASSVVIWQVFQKLNSKFSGAGVVFIVIFLGVWSLGSYVTIQFSNLTHWAPKRARITKIVLGELKKRYRSLDAGSIVYLPKDSLLKVTLNDQLALHLIYGDSTIQTSYNEGKEEDREKFIPKNDRELIERYPIEVSRQTRYQ